VHSLEDIVAELKKRAELSGNDFLPMVLKLDDLIAHLRNVRELAGRLTTMRDLPLASAASVRAQLDRDDLSPTLHSLAERLAKDHQKTFKLSLHGLADIPRAYQATIKDVMIQMLRNAAVHGIEPAEVRRAHTKQDVGVVRAEFRQAGSGYELLFEDDGAGLEPEELKAVALRRQMVTPEEAAAMDTRAAMALIFRAGFSTQDNVSMDAGRGVGMDVIARSVYALGGKIGVTTNPGKFTRFRVALPATVAASTAVA
jgi:two-component system chemotaxis sensor kinase CheA